MSNPLQRIGRAALPHLLEARAPFEAAAAVALGPLWWLAPRGDGHPVLVLPGLVADDASTALLRAFLRSRGYAVAGWGLGVNVGLSAGLMARALRTLQRLRAGHGRAVSLVGWSLGGVYARELAKQAPYAVRQVVTLGSPFAAHPRSTDAWRVYRRAAGRRYTPQEIDHPLRTAPPVPTTSIWSRSDAVVPWPCSFETRRHQAENIEVDASHCGLGVHPAVLYAIADRLAQPEGAWRPFHRYGWRRVVYGDPQAPRDGRRQGAAA